MSNFNTNVLPSLLSAGGSIVDAGLQFITNKQQQDYSEHMYRQQRIDALSDWNRQNAYNLTTAQMQRLHDAGLNPNLVYGNGTSTLASTVRPASGGSYNPTAPRIGAPLIDEMYNTKLKQAQVSALNANTETQNALRDDRKKQLVMDILLKGKNADLIDSKTAGQTLKNVLDSTLAGTYQEAAETKLAGLKLGNQVTYINTILNMFRTKASLDQTVASIAHMMQMDKESVSRIHGNELTDWYQKWKNQLAGRGITEHDPYYFRMGSQAVNELIKIFGGKIP